MHRCSQIASALRRASQLGWPTAGAAELRSGIEQCFQVPTLTAPCRQGAAGAAPGLAMPLRRSFASGAAVPASPALRGQSTSHSGGSSRGGWAGGFLLVPSMVAALLGKWQLDRRQWKLDLLQRREAKLKGDAVDLFAVEEPPEEYQRVRLIGTFEPGASLYVGPRVRTIMGRTETGYLAFTPLHSTSHPGRTVLVNRGWVPAAWRQEAEAAAAAAPSAAAALLARKWGKSQQQGGSDQEVVVIDGVVRCGEDPGSFVPDNAPSSGAWYYVNPGEMAAAVHLPEGTPLVEIITPESATRMVSPGGPPTAMDVLGGRGAGPAVQETYPLPKSAGDLMAFSVMPRDHMNYAATWFTLSAATAGLALRALRQAPK